MMATIIIAKATARTTARNSSGVTDGRIGKIRAGGPQQAARLV